MTSLALTALIAFSFVQTSAANPACALLTPAQVTSLIGAAKTLPMQSAPNGSTCMLQNGDKVITVLLSVRDSAETATFLFESKKRIVAGQAIAGWTIPSYAGSMAPDASVVGYVNGATFTEVKMIDKTKYPEGALARLVAVMKDAAAKK